MMRLLLLMLTIAVSLFPCVSSSVGIYLVPHGECRLEALWGKHWAWHGGHVEQYPGAPVTATMSSCSHAMAASFLHVIPQPVYICQAFY